MATVLLIEDDASIRQALSRSLSDAGHSVTSSGKGLEGLELLMKERPEVLVLDLGLPDIAGSDLLRMVRSVSSVPVVVATAQDDERSIVAVLDAGADDYVVKPFSADQLEARIRAVLRRTQEESGSSTIQVGDLQIDVEAHEAKLGSVTLELTPKEFDLLRVLAEHQGRVMSKRDLLAEVWRQPYGAGDKTVDVHVSWLRRKLGESAAEPRYIVTVRGVGVKLVDPG